MNSLTLSAVAFLLILGGVAVGAMLRNRLPAHHLDSDSRDVVRLGAGLVGTIAALVLGLLIASAKGSFDGQSGQVTQLTADIALLDHILELYGPEARPARELLRSSVQPMVERIWRRNESRAAPGSSFNLNPAAEATYVKILELSPQNDAQRALKARAIQASVELGQARLLLAAQAGGSIPKPFLAVLIFWLLIIFASFSLFSRLHATLIAALVVFALSASAAIFLVLELSSPFAGLLEVSSAPLRSVLPPLER